MLCLNAPCRSDPLADVAAWAPGAGDQDFTVSSLTQCLRTNRCESSFQRAGFVVYLEMTAEDTRENYGQPGTRYTLVVHIKGP
jgi:hypothetical protein